MLCNEATRFQWASAAHLREAGLPGVPRKGGELDVAAQAAVLTEGFSSVALPGAIPASVKPRADSDMYRDVL